MLTWSGADGALKSILPGFEAAYPDIKVDLQVLGYDDVSSRLNVGLQSGTDLPDVVSIVSDRVPTVTGMFPDGLADLRGFGLETDRWAAAKWPALTGPDGQLFGVPWDLGPVAMYYRTDMLAAVGVDPASIETWDDYRDLGAKLAQQGIHLFPVQVDNSQLYSTMLQQFGQSYFTETGEVAVTSPQSIRVAELLRQAVDDGYALVTNNDQDYVASYKNERVATLLKPAWYSGMIASNAPDQSGSWGVAPLPALEESGLRASNQGGSNLVIPANAKNKDAAYTFVMYALGEVSSAITMLEATGFMPSLLDAFPEPAFDQPVEYFGGQAINRVFADTIPQIPAVPITADFDIADQAVIDAINRILVADAPIADTLQSAADQIDNQTRR